MYLGQVRPESGSRVAGNQLLSRRVQLRLHSLPLSSPSRLLFLADASSLGSPSAKTMPAATFRPCAQDTGTAKSWLQVPALPTWECGQGRKLPGPSPICHGHDLPQRVSGTAPQQTVGSVHGTCSRDLLPLASLGPVRVGHGLLETFFRLSAPRGLLLEPLFLCLVSVAIPTLPRHCHSPVPTSVANPATSVRWVLFVCLFF